MLARHEHFDHDADIGVRGRGATIAEAFEQAAVALTAVITDPQRVSARLAVDVACQAPTQELLLVDWLNTIIYESAIRGLLFGRFEVQIDGNRLRGRLHGEKLDRQRHQPAVEPKGATYTALRVAEEPGAGYVAECVIDV